METHTQTPHRHVATHMDVSRHTRTDVHTYTGKYLAIAFEGARERWYSGSKREGRWRSAGSDNYSLPESPLVALLPWKSCSWRELNGVEKIIRA